MQYIQHISETIRRLGPTTANPEIKAQAYLDQVLTQLMRGLFLATDQQLNDNQIPVSFDLLRQGLGRYGSRGQQKYWFDWFQEHCPLIHKQREGYRVGNRGELTMVTTDINLEILLASKDPKEIFDFYFKQAIDTDAACDLVPIDMASLKAYIQANEHNTRGNQRYRRALSHNLIWAKIIFNCAGHCRGQLPQIIKWSEFGRKYYSGVNLQSASKIVRHAALGDCHQYDIESSVFSWKLMASQCIDSEFDAYATKRYLESKNYFRRQLAESLFGNTQEHSINTVKKLITAIGFGASAHSGSWRNQDGTWSASSLKEILYSPELLKKFVTDPWVSAFIDEQRVMSRIIFNYYKDSVKDIKILQNQRGTLNVNKTISYLYQHQEASVIADLEQRFKDYGILLRCHDAFYTKQAVPLGELREYLDEIMPGARINHEQHHAYTFADNSEEELHRHRILEEEYRARQHAENQGLEYTSGIGQVIKRLAKPRQVEDFDAGHWDEQRAMEYYDMRRDPFYEDYSEQELLSLEREFNKISHPDWVLGLINKEQS